MWRLIWKVMIQIGSHIISSRAFTYILFPLKRGRVGQGFEEASLRSFPYIKHWQNAKTEWKTYSSFLTASLLDRSFTGLWLLVHSPIWACCKFIPSQLKPGGALALFAQWTSRHLPPSLFVCFFFFPYCLLHFIHCLPCTLPLSISHWSQTGDHLPFSVPIREQQAHMNQTLPLHHPGALCCGNMHCDVQYITCKSHQTSEQS